MNRTRGGGLNYDYYWRDYTGRIPSDAVEGGRDLCNRTTYIGQVYVHKFGISTVTIYPGQTSVQPSKYATYAWNHIKILCCSYQENLKWVPAEAQTLHVKLIGKHLVRGGVENNGVPTNIGRIMHKGELIVAKVCAGDVGNAKLYYSDKDGNEKSTDNYEILVYEM